MKCKALGIAAVLLFTMSASAAGDLKPGLWEMTVVHATEATEQETLDERKQAEAHMFKKKGTRMKMDQEGSSIRMTIQVCLTPEATIQEIMQVQPHRGCPIKTSRTGNTVKLSYTCAEPPSSGGGEITFQNDTAYSMTMWTVDDGQRTDFQAFGRWLNGGCGNVKPSQPVK
ncbi:MAG: DUF3617 domain-containing protein [Zoogloeaceae bacterium]|jgi:2',3'-cyclic-nucleotide 2'-phosphodiesterase (5'-nucleotidase family)|nr:DUF3617 domain-containing protein [Zoogloeaceae bacterium]